MSTRYELRQADRARTWAKVRRWVYGICIAAVPLAIFLGWLPAEAAPLVLPLILAIFNVKEPNE